MYIYLNGKFVPEKKAMLHVTDLAIIRGFGIFDFLQNVDGVPLFIEDHIARFKNSAAKMGIIFDFEKHNIKEIVTELLVKNGNLAHSGLKMILTGGYSEDGFTPTDANFFIFETPIKQNPDYQGFITGEKLMLFDFVRESADVKTINYSVAVTKQNEWKSKKAIDILYHKDGLISESSRANFFIINDKGVLITPKSDVLHGITRKKVLEAAASLGIANEVRDMTIEETLQAKEAFLSGSTKPVLPIVQLDDFAIANGKPGELTLKIRAAFLQMQQTYKQNYKATH